MKIYIFYTLIAFISVAHLSKEVLKAIPYNPLTRYYAPVINQINSGMFVQDWRLFSPEPPTKNFRFNYRCKTNQVWTNWIDPVEAHLYYSKKNLFSPHQYMVRHLKHAIKMVAMDDYQISNSNLCISENDFDCVSRNLNKRKSYIRLQNISNSLCIKNAAYSGTLQIRFLEIELHS